MSLRKILFILTLLSATAQADDLNFCSTTYSEARLQFRNTCVEVGANLTPYLLNSKQEELSVDVCTSEKIQKKLLIITSGTHGVEGHAGSFIQRNFLKKQLMLAKKNGWDFLLIHSLNPWGMQQNRRTTANNVDLNRHFLMNSDQQLPQNDGYKALQGLLEPQMPFGSYMASFARVASSLIWKLVSREASMQQLTHAVAQGQYHSNRGLFYGGNIFQAPERQVELVAEILKNQDLAGYESILHFDIHTGLGEKKKLHLIYQKMTPEQESKFSNISDRIALTNEKSPGFYPTTGDYLTYTQNALNQRGLQNILSITAEFGTLGNGVIPKIRTVHRMVAENQTHFFDGKTPDNKEAALKNFKELFCPNDESWMENTRSLAENLFEQALKP